jgi:hypothetical protein
MKDVRFIWGLPKEDSFMKLKGLITLAPSSYSLMMISQSQSGIATGTALSQQSRTDHTWHPLMFLSKALM